VSIPVAAGTQIQDVTVAERVLRQGKADLVYMARALLADPELPNKAKEGRLADIRPCMNCCRCIEDSDAPPVYCSVNARLSREWEYPAEAPAQEPKRVLVVGGGPAGMEAARIAALRGHEVTLCERGPRLGGSLLLAAITNRRMGNVLRHLAREVRRLPIDVRLNTEATPALVDSVQPHAVVLAAGGTAPALDVPGGDGAGVLDHRDMKQFMAGRSLGKGGPGRRIVSRLAALFVRWLYEPSLIRWLLKFGYPFGRRVAIVGGGFAGLELGVTLSGRGKEVTVVEESDRIGADVGLVHRWVWMKQLREAGTRLETRAAVKEITDRGLVIGREGSTEAIEADTVVLAGALAPDTALAGEFAGRAPVIHVIGDCDRPGRLLEAVASGFLTGQQV